MEFCKIANTPDIIKRGIGVNLICGVTNGTDITQKAMQGIRFDDMLESYIKSKGA